MTRPVGPKLQQVNPFVSREAGGSASGGGRRPLPGPSSEGSELAFAGSAGALGGAAAAFRAGGPQASFKAPQANIANAGAPVNHGGQGFSARTFGGRGVAGGQFDTTT